MPIPGPAPGQPSTQSGLGGSSTGHGGSQDGLGILALMLFSRVLLGSNLPPSLGFLIFKMGAKGSAKAGFHLPEGGQWREAAERVLSVLRVRGKK